MKRKNSKRDEWPKRLDDAIKVQFGRETETYFDLIGSMRYVTSPTDGKPLTDEIHCFIREWMEREPTT